MCIKIFYGGVYIIVLASKYRGQAYLKGVVCESDPINKMEKSGLTCNIIGVWCCNAIEDAYEIKCQALKSLPYSTKLWRIGG